MTDTLTDDELNQIEARCNAATPGPWKQGNAGAMTVFPDDDCVPIAFIGEDHYSPIAWIGGEYERQRKWDNINFIAAARTDIPRLVAEVRRLREENARLKEAQSFLKETIKYWDFSAEWKERE